MLTHRKYRSTQELLEPIRMLHCIWDNSISVALFRATILLYRNGGHSTFFGRYMCHADIRSDCRSRAEGLKSRVTGKPLNTGWDTFLMKLSNPQQSNL